MCRDADSVMSCYAGLAHAHTAFHALTLGCMAAVLFWGWVRHLHTCAAPCMHVTLLPATHILLLLPCSHVASTHGSTCKALGGLLTGLSCACVQYYFETIFPRIPKLVQDQFETKLTAMGLPSKAVGNAGQVAPFCGIDAAAGICMICVQRACYFAALAYIVGKRAGQQLPVSSVWLHDSSDDI